METRKLLRDATAEEVAAHFDAIDEAARLRAELVAMRRKAVSLAQERGRDVRGWVLSRPLPLRWAIIIGAVVAVLLLGVWGSGFDEATFIYYQL